MLPCSSSQPSTTIQFVEAIFSIQLTKHMLVACYHAHPVNQAQIGYGGVAEEQIQGITDW